jgi:RNA polymerase sigma factor (TIGR02999 family)
MPIAGRLPADLVLGLTLFDRIGRLRGNMSAGGFTGGAPGNITRFLQEWRSGDEEALARLTAEVYRELRRLAGALFARESGERTLQPTALVHELYLQLPDVQHIDWQSRAQFLNVAARMMRNILVDHARKRNAAKRGGGETPVVKESAVKDPAMEIDVLMVDAALERFTEQYPRQSRVVELRFFGGLTAEETAEVLNATGTETSLRTVERDWTFARAWLENAIGSF